MQSHMYRIQNRKMIILYTRTWAHLHRICKVQKILIWFIFLSCFFYLQKESDHFRMASHCRKYFIKRWIWSSHFGMEHCQRAGRQFYRVSSGCNLFHIVESVMNELMTRNYSNLTGLNTWELFLKWPQNTVI